MKNIFSARILIFRKLSPFLPNKKFLYMLLGVQAGLVAVGTIKPLFYKLFVDKVLISNKLYILIPVILGYLFMFLSETLLLLEQRIISNRVFFPFVAKLKLRLLKNLAQMPFDVYEQHSTGDISNTIYNDANACSTFFEKQIVEFIYNWCIVVVLGLALLSISWPLALFGFIMVPLSFLLTKTLKKKGGAAAAGYRAAYGEYEGFVHTSLQNWREIRAMNLEEQYGREFSGHWDRLSPLFVKRQLLWYLNRGVIAFKDLFVTRMNLYFLGGLLVFSSHLSVSGLLVFMAYYETMFASVNAIHELDMSMAELQPSVDRVLELCNRRDAAARTNKVDTLFGGLYLRQVAFSYQEGEQTLHGIDLHIKPGDKIALVGRSGSGKTTLGRLLVGILQPQEGDILLNGIRLSTIQRNTLYKTLGYVPQEPYFFNLSIRDNLLLANGKAERRQLESVCQQACILDFIFSLPEGFDTVIGEKGVKLSGGQKQRLAIARALLRDTPFLLLDEVTSALDYEVEKKIQTAINAMVTGDKSIIRIAHRLSSIVGSTHIIVVDNNTIVGAGCHSQLLAQCPEYAALFAGS